MITIKNLIRKSVASVAIAAAVAGVGVTAAPTSVSAAAPNVSFCLVYSTGAPYASKPVYLYRWNGAAWESYKTGSTNAAGCATWKAVAANSYYITQGYWQYNVGSAIYAWSGYTTNYVYAGLSGTYNNGSGVVYQTRLY